MGGAANSVESSGMTCLCLSRPVEPVSLRVAAQGLNEFGTARIPNEHGRYGLSDTTIFPLGLKSGAARKRPESRFPGDLPGESAHHPRWFVKGGVK